MSARPQVDLAQVADGHPPVGPSVSQLYTRQLALLMRIHHAADAGLDEAIRFGVPHEALLAITQWATEGVHQLAEEVKAGKEAVPL